MNIDEMVDRAYRGADEHVAWLNKMNDSYIPVHAEAWKHFGMEPQKPQPFIKPEDSREVLAQINLLSLLKREELNRSTKPLFK